MTGPERGGVRAIVRRGWAAAAALTLAVPLLAHAYAGSYSRPIADDFCTLGSLSRLGFLESQVYWYTTWSGRFSFTFTVSLLQSLGNWIVPLLPALALVAWVAAAWTLARHALPSDSSRGALALGVLVVSLAVSTTPNAYQSLYWLTGMLTYALPLVALTAFAAWAWGRSETEARPTGGELAFSAAVGFVVGGFSETTLALQIVALALGVVTLAARPPKQGKARLLAAALVGSLAAAAVVVAAPGNAVRGALMPPPPDLLTLAGRSVRDVVIFAARARGGYPAALGLALAMPFLLGALDGLGRGAASPGPGSALALLGLPAATGALLLACFAPSEYAVSSYPDGRVLLTAHYVLFVGVAFWSAALGLTFGRRTRVMKRVEGSLLVLACALALPLSLGVAWGEVRDVAAELPDARAYARAWDSRDEASRRAAASGEQRVAVASLSHMGGLDEIAREPDYWLNVCFAQAYALQQVTAK